MKNIKSHNVLSVAALIVLSIIALLYVVTFDVRGGINHAPLGINDAHTIQSWMTFDYINNVYHLPSDYLKNTFIINDSRYPLITLGRYAASKHFDPAVFNTSVQSAVRIYLNAPR